MRILAFFAFVLLTCPAHSAVLLSDSFSYQDGPLVGATGSPWAAHSSGTSAEVVDGQLQVTFARSEDVSAPLAGQPYGSGSGVVLYASFTVRFSALPTSGGSYFAHFHSGSHVARIFANTSGAPAGSFRLGIANSTTTSSQLATNLSLNTTYKLAVSYDTASGQSKLWLDPGYETDPAISASDATSTVNVTSFAFRQATGIGTMLVDDLKVATSFNEVVPPLTGVGPTVTAHPQSVTVTEGDPVTLSVSADGTGPLSYQWFFENVAVSGESASSFSIAYANLTNAGTYHVVVTNAFGSAVSGNAIVAVDPFTAYQPAAFSVLTYNVKGNGATNWTTNALQVQAIGRQVAYLNADIITFQEIPLEHSNEMTNFVKAYLPGYSLAANSGTDGFIRSVIASRFPIIRSSKWLDGVSLASFGYTGNFSRDLFEAEINVPNFSQPLHVFTTHLKALSDTNSAARRAAEASAITNFFATNFLPTKAHRPFLLTGDMNEDIDRPPSSSLQPIERLTNSTAGFRLTTPRNPFTNDERTWSSSSPSIRFDYILPGGLLFSNINNSQIFRSDKLPPTILALQTNDSQVASDHLPVLMVFNNPYEGPFRITSMQMDTQTVTMSWQSNTGRQYRVESSADLAAWSVLASNLVANGTNFTFTTNTTDVPRFYRVNRL